MDIYAGVSLMILCNSLFYKLLQILVFNSKLFGEFYIVYIAGYYP